MCINMSLKSSVFFALLCTRATVLCRFLPKIGFFTEMLKLPQNMWSRQQMWVGILLVALLFFNNVFFAAQVSY
jgi:Wnt-binding factor required for Wnt secretion